MEFVVPVDLVGDLGKASEVQSPEQQFQQILSLSGELYRDLNNRRTFSCELNGQQVFVKAHLGAGWREVIKAWLRGQKALVDARHEWLAIKKLQTLGVQTLDPIAFGCDNQGPAKRRSFLITKALENRQGLDAYLASFDGNIPWKLKRRLVHQVADMVRAMHQSGMVHRDCYLCHFLIEPETQVINLIDLHRATSYQKIPQTLQVKDLAALAFSARLCGLNDRDLIRFCNRYGLEIKSKLAQAVFKKAQWLMAKYPRKFRQEAEQKAGSTWLAPSWLLSYRLGRVGNDVKLPATIQLSSHGEPVKLTKILRQAKGKRLVCLAEWGNRTVVIKLFHHPLKSWFHWRKEDRGVRWMQSHAVNTPRILYSGRVAGSTVKAILFSYVPNAIEQSEFKGEAVGKAFLQASLPLIASMHNQGGVQTDMHLGNFLFVPSSDTGKSSEKAQYSLFVIDGSDLLIRDEPLSSNEAEENLALFFAQFPQYFIAFLPSLYEHYWRLRKQDVPADWSSFEAKFKTRALERMQMLAEKSLRASSGVFLKESWLEKVLLLKPSRSALFAREVSTTRQRALVELSCSQVEYLVQTHLQDNALKLGNSATVVQACLQGSPVVIKRYNLKTLWHALRRGLRKTRAEISWQNAHVLQSLMVPTAKPLGLFVKKFGPIRLTSYFVMDEIAEAKSLTEALAEVDERGQHDLLQQVNRTLEKLHWAGIVHGDMKATNWLVDAEGNVYLIDLDAMCFVKDKYKFSQAWQKDMRRFQLNWPEGDRPDIPQLKLKTNRFIS